MINSQFYVENYLVDSSRNQVVFEGQSYPLPPKAIAVLCLLAERQGEVISFEEILATIWHDRVVSTNTLQRCISQIRQVFNDDSTQQAVIKTHARKGYSLELLVQNDAPSRGMKYEQKPGLTMPTILLSGLVLSVLCIFFYELFIFENQPVSYHHIVPLTASDAWESNGSFSPDGRFVLFQRHSDNCHSHLWLKDVESNRETKLTAREGVYGKASWSADGNNIAFAERNTCQPGNADEQFCWSINTIDIMDAMQAPQEPVARFDCKDQATWDTGWLPSGAITFIQENSKENAEIKIYDPKSGRISAVPQNQEKYYYNHDFAVQSNNFAALAIDKNNQYWLDRLSFDGQLLSSAKIDGKGLNTPPDGLTFHVSENYLLTQIDAKPFKLDFDGRITEIVIGSRNTLTDFDFVPFSDDLIATEVIADTDPLMIPYPLSKTNPDWETQVLATLNAEMLSDFVLNRSNLSDDNAKFQPSGSLLALLSNRTGSRQIWVKDGKEVRQISQIRHGSLHKSIVWSPSGQAIAGIVNQQLVIWDLSGQQIYQSENVVIETLLQWVSEDQVLLNLRQEGTSALVLLCLSSQKVKDLNIDDALWASFAANGDLLYFDRNRQFWRQKNGETELIPSLSNQLEQPRAVMTGNTLYGINPQFQLWSYSLDNHSYKKIYQLPKSLRYVSDYNGNDFLMTYMQRLTKDLVLLTTP